MICAKALPRKEAYGLAHILEKHPEITAEILKDVMENGELEKSDYERLTIKTENYTIGLKSNYNGKSTKNRWVITAYYKGREASKFNNSTDFTEEKTLPSNSTSSIILTKQRFKQEL